MSRFCPVVVATLITTLALARASVVLMAGHDSPGDAGPADLNGTWRGEWSAKARGCRFNGRPVDVVAQFRHLPDGTVRVSVQSDAPSARQTLAGRIEGDGRLTLTTHPFAECGPRNRRTYEIEYRGKAEQKKGAWVVKMSALDVPCPPTDCRLTRQFELRKQ